jgi:hypothetical protein
MLHIDEQQALARQRRTRFSNLLRNRFGPVVRHP